MKIFTLIAFLVVGLQVMAQSYSLTVFNNGGQQFFVIMNGIRQNSLPLTNVKIGGLSQGSYEVKLIFADGKTADINKKIFLDEPGDYLGRVTFKKGKGRLQYFGTTGGGTQAPGGSTNVIYRPTEQSGFSDQPVQTQQTPVNTSNLGAGSATNSTMSQNPNSQGTTNIQGSSTSMNSTTNTTTNGNGQAGGINMNVNVSDPTMNGNGGVNMNVNISDPVTTGNGGVGTNTTIVDPVTGETIQMNVGISMSGMDSNNPGMNTQTTTTVTSSQTPNTIGANATIHGSGTAINSSTSATTSGNGQNGGVNMNVNISDPVITGNGGVGTNTTIVDPVTGETIQMNVGISMSGMDPNNPGINTQTTTTTTSSSTSTMTTTTNVQQNVNINSSGQQTNQNQQGTPQIQRLDGQCNGVFTSTTYVEELKRLTFDEDRLISIQNTFKTKCLTSGYAHTILETLTFSGDRLEMAKFMYMRLTDPVNAMSLADLFTFDSEKEEFEMFVTQNRR
jgi:hypothetical protein